MANGISDPKDRKLRIRNRLQNAGMRGEALERAVAFASGGARRFPSAKVGPKGVTFEDPTEELQLREEVRRQRLSRK